MATLLPFSAAGDPRINRTIKLERHPRVISVSRPPSSVIERNLRSLSLDRGPGRSGAPLAQNCHGTLEDRVAVSRRSGRGVSALVEPTGGVKVARGSDIGAVGEGALVVADLQHKTLGAHPLGPEGSPPHTTRT
jgi:hypothetical protein